MPQLGPGRLLAERRAMVAWRRSMMITLANRPVADAPNVAALYPDADNLLEGLMAHAATLPRSDRLSGILLDVVQYERMNMDVEAVRQFLGVSNDWIDQLFRDAMAVGET